MIGIAYFALVVAVIRYVAGRRRPWLRRLGPSGRLWLRLGAAASALALAAVGVVVLRIQTPEGEAGISRWLGTLIGGALLAGAVLHLAGLLLWRGQAALMLRATGWGLITAALVGPSTLTLLLPLPALMLFTLTTPPPGPAADSPRPDPAPST